MTINLKQLQEEIMGEYNEEYGATGVFFIREALNRQLSAIIEIIEDMKKESQNAPAGTRSTANFDDIINKLKI